jgi:hypothetical protein
MSISKNSTALKFAAGFIGLAMALSMVSASPANAQSVEDLTAQINSLLATISSLQAQLAGMTGGGSSSSSSVCPFAWTTNLKTGSQGPDVMALQKFLNSNPATQVAASGVGSPGAETDYFGGLTSKAVAAFQDLHAAQVLTPVGLSAGTGYFGPSTRAHMNSLCTSAPVVDDSADDSADDTAGDDTTTSGSGVTIGAGSQPANSIAPLGASRVPFTVFTLTAGSDGPVTISSVTVERTGFADNTNFSGVVLLGPDMEMIGNAKTLNSNNQAKVGKSYTIPAGESRTFTIAGNRPTAAVSTDGQVASLSVVAVNTSATVSGALPITGASHVMNETLGIGAAQVDVGPSDLDSAQTEEVGATNKIFAALRITNTSSNEDMRVRSLRFQQVGSASADDIDNVRVLVDGVEYPTVRDGDFYTATLGSGVVIAEGFNKEFVLRGDIVGGSARTVQFNVDKSTDLYITGETYGFGIVSTGTNLTTATNGAEMLTSGSPFFDGSLFTVSAGSLTTFSKSNDVPAQNIAINVPNQPLGAFTADVKGEAMTVQSMTFYFQFVGGLVGTDLTNISLVDGNGAVIGGPSDGVAVAANVGKVTFSDTVTLPVGKSTLTLKGKLSTNFVNDDTVVASTTPSADWTTVEGEETGDTITLSNGVTTGNTMTVKAAAVSAKVSTSPAAQQVVGGVSGMVVANIQLDGTQSGEDVRFTSLQLRYTNGGAGGDPTNCRLFDGSTQLTDDGVDPTTTATAYTFTLDQNITVAKGTIKTLAVQCDVTASVAAGSTFSFGVNTADTISGTGINSGSSVDASDNTNVGPTMTVTGAGTLAVTLDSSSPSYKLAAAGTSDVTLGVFKVAATNEAIRLDRVALQLSNSTASSSASDLLSVGIYNGSTLVGQATFSGSTRNATSTLTQTVTVPKDGDVKLTIKATMAEIGSSKSGTQGALVQVDYDGDDSDGTRGVGMDSGATIDAADTSSSDTASAGVRLFRSFPVFAKIAVPTGTLTNSDNTFYRFSVTADSADDISVYKFTVRMSTTTGVSLTDVNIFAYTDAGFSTPVSGVRADGALDLAGFTVVDATDQDFIIENAAGTPTPLEIPAGTTRYFELRGVASGVGTNDTVSSSLRGDAAYPSLATLMDSATNIDADANNDFIWSPQATSTPGITSNDWTNGFGIIGLPAVNMTTEVLSES